MNKLLSPDLLRLLVTSVLALITSACGSNTSTENQDSGQIDLAIHNVTVIDARTGVRKNRNVYVRGDKVIGIEQFGSGLMPKSRRAIDGQGKFLIPGLWDAHVHLSFDESIASSMFRLFIANGVTSARDTGGQLDLVLAAREASKVELAPSVYIAGPLLDGEPTVYAGKAKGFPKIASTIRTPERAVAEVDRLAAAGVDQIKAYEMLSPEVFKAVLNRAKFHGLPVTGHVPLGMTAIDAASAGLNSMEHMRNLQMDCSSNDAALLTQREELLLNKGDKLGSTLRSEIHAAQHFSAIQSYDADRCQELLKQLAKFDAWQVPTMTLNMLFKKPYYGEPEWQKTYQYLPADVAANWLQRSTRVVKRLTAPSERQTQRLKVADWQINMLKQIVDAGIPVMAGTDTPIFYLTPGFSLHKELQSLVDAGMTPLQAIESATLTPLNILDWMKRKVWSLKECWQI